MPPRRAIEPVARLDPVAVLAWRTSRGLLRERAPASDWERVVSRVCGLHAQLMSSAELTLWARVDGLAKSTVERALWQDKTLVIHEGAGSVKWR